MSDKRNYRHGETYRNGNITKEKLCKELGFKSVKFSKTFVGNKQTALNNIYDGLLDMSKVINQLPTYMSLGDPDMVDGYTLVFSEKNSPLSLKIDSNCNYGYNWFKSFDRSLGDMEITKSEKGYLSYIGKMCEPDEVEYNYPKALNLLNVIKYKEVETFNINSKEVSSVLSDLEMVIDKIPIISDETHEEVASVEDAIIRFKRELTNTRLSEMISAISEYIEKYGLQLGELKDELMNTFNSLSAISESNSENNKITQTVKTEYYSNYCKNVPFPDETKIACYIFECYLYDKCKELGISNNYLYGDMDNALLYPKGEERLAMVNAMEGFLSEIFTRVDYNFVENKKEDVKEELELTNNEAVKKDSSDVSTHETNTINNIDNMLKRDLGKFKMTLFKSIAKEKGLNIDVDNIQTKEYGTDGCVSYVIPIKGSKVKALYVRSPYNIESDNNFFRVYLNKVSDNEIKYKWSYELDYNDLVDTLLSYAKESKFELTKFKNLCKSEGLKVLFTETPIIKLKGKEIYEIEFSHNSYIKLVSVPIYSSDKIEYVIKSLGGEFIHQQVDDFDYNDLIKVIVKISNEGIESLSNQINKLKQEKNGLVKQADEVRKGYEKSNASSNNKLKSQVNTIIDSSDVKETKELRQKLTQYVALNSIKYNYSRTPGNLLNALNRNCEVNPILGFDVIPEGKSKGRSKSWSFKNNGIVISRSADGRKQSEAIIEGFVTYVLNNKISNSLDRKMYIDSVTFMICKGIGLDVRTYCSDSNFEDLVTSSKRTSNFIIKSLKLYESVAKYFEVM